MKLPNDEDLTLIRQAIHLPIVLAIVEKNKAEIAESSYALKTLYVNATDALLDRVLSDMTAIKRDLRRRKIKVWKVEGRPYSYAYMCNGYEKKFDLLREKLKVDVGLLLTEYINQAKKK